ncbi:FMRFamide receptor [Elysia marginata]|uniref:FMRFamide receptor n=1 Tax=Elysia marginata TaxID=1093978 RepID=A0AAV4IQ62_9GAST|nr:FMRFamide receptor [Elysia marginata]
MFAETFTGSETESVARLTKNYSNIPQPYTLCVIHVLKQEYDIHTENWDSRDATLAGNIRIALDGCLNGSQIEKVIGIIAIILGLPGNLMATIVSLSIDRITTSVFITALSIGDFLTIMFRTTIPNTTYMPFEVFKISLGFFPNSILVLICFERYMAVCYPFVKREWLTTKVARRLVAAFVLIFVLAYIGCCFLTLSELTEGKKTLMFSFLLFGLPCPFIVIFNCLTVRKLKQVTLEKQNAKMQMRFWSKAEASITLMIIIASVVFLVLNGPLFAVCCFWYIIYTYFNDIVNISFHTKIDALIDLTYWLTFLHHGANFYIYILGTKRFRMQSIYLFKRLKRVAWIPSFIETPHASQIFNSRSARNNELSSRGNHNYNYFYRSDNDQADKHQRETLIL